MRRNIHTNACDPRLAQVGSLKRIHELGRFDLTVAVLIKRGDEAKVLTVQRIEPISRFHAPRGANIDLTCWRCIILHHCHACSRVKCQCDAKSPWPN